MTPRSQLTLAAVTLTLIAGLARAQEPFQPMVDAAPVGRFYASAEYLSWWLREARAPVALTTSSFDSRGLLGQPDTRVLYGGDRLETRHDDRFIGTRFQVGWWLDPERTWAIEGGGFFLERDSTYFKKVSDGSVLLARPYYDARTGQAASEIIAGPTPDGVRNGGFQGYSRVELFSEEANLVANVFADPSRRLDLLVGGRFLQMRDRTDFTATGRLLPDQAILYGLTDHYRVHNAFYGSQLGLRGSQQFGRFSLGLRGEAALGANVETVTAYGDRVYHTPLARIATPYGLTTTSTNTGTFQRTELNGIYEVGVNLGYQVSQRIKLFGGYTFLLWDGAVRSGDQVDLLVNPTPAAGGPQRPTIPFRDDVFWAHGLNVGLELTW